MTQYDFALLLAIVGGTYLLTAAVGKATGDARRDVFLMGGLGIALGSVAAALHLA